MFSTTLVVAALACCSLAQQTAPVVDLEYARYQGRYNATLDQNIYRGVRFAAPPVGTLRWQLPQAPTQNRIQIIQADSNPPLCPQSSRASGPPTNATSGDEDCLFLNVFAPANASNLPVFVWIHGGGYGLGGTLDYDLGQQVRNNDNSYIAVVIQYRLGAFGYLSSAELARFGVPNAGIHDMRFALRWVQKHIHLFGGNPASVTIGGESAGGGAVMLLTMAEGGGDEHLFGGVLTSSPYLPTQWKYDDSQPSESYYRFAEKAGCLTDALAAFGTVFDCLVAADTATLQIASDYVSATTRYGQWAFIPVTDGSLVRERPAAQLRSGKLNGGRILSTNTLNEGAAFTSQGITDESGFRRFLGTNYPMLSRGNVSSILECYGVPDNVPRIQADSAGWRPPFSTTNSIYGFGWQQAANNFYSEATFVCPSYWLADAFARKPAGAAWHYQYSVSPAAHGNDMDPVLAGPEQMTDDTTTWEFRAAMQHAWGNFIVHGVPGLAPVRGGPPESDISRGGLLGGGQWPRWMAKQGQDHMLNMNMTGGVAVPFVTNLNGHNITIATNIRGNGSTPPLQPVFEVVEGSAWEDGRGERCRLLADLGPWLME